MNRRQFIGCVRSDRGTAAVEFAIVGPIFLMLIIGLIYTCMLLFTMGSMQFAVEEGARCASVQTTVCTNNATTISHALGAYYGPIAAPTFTSSLAACGHVVSSTTSFSFNMGLSSVNVPLTATSCFP